MLKESLLLVGGHPRLVGQFTGARQIDTAEHTNTITMIFEPFPVRIECLFQDVVLDGFVGASCQASCYR